jgi:hypothetical protein
VERVSAESGGAARVSVERVSAEREGVDAKGEPAAINAVKNSRQVGHPQRGRELCRLALTVLSSISRGAAPA